MDPRSLTGDFKEFLRCLNDQGVEYLVIGGHAVAYHGYPRATRDLDVWVAVNRANAGRLSTALRRFGFNQADVDPPVFLNRDQVIRMGIAPNRIEILTGIEDKPKHHGKQRTRAFDRGSTCGDE